MNVNNNLQGLQQLLSSEPVKSAAPKTGASSSHAISSGKDQATLSSAASMAAASAPDSDVRMDKVASVQQALAAGTYNVPASAVAGKMMDHLLGK
jgi:negative regulator of flagellin synthesis FlgM